MEQTDTIMVTYILIINTQKPITNKIALINNTYTTQ